MVWFQADWGHCQVMLRRRLISNLGGGGEGSEGFFLRMVLRGLAQVILCVFLAKVLGSEPRGVAAGILQNRWGVCRESQSEHNACEWEHFEPGFEDPPGEHIGFSEVGWSAGKAVAIDSFR